MSNKPPHKRIGYRLVPLPWFGKRVQWDGPPDNAPADPTPVKVKGVVVGEDDSGVLPISPDNDPNNRKAWITKQKTEVEIIG